MYMENGQLYNDVSLLQDEQTTQNDYPVLL